MPAGIPEPQPPPPEGRHRPDDRYPAQDVPDLPRVTLWRLRRNPLRRRTDLLQAWLSLGLFLTALAAAPTAMFLVGDAAYGHYRETADAQARTRRPTTAVLLHPAPRHPEPGSPEAKRTRYPVEVRFTGPDGRPRTARTDVTPGLPAGTAIDIWSDPDGRLTAPPLTTDEIRSRTMGWAILAFLTPPALAAALYATTSLTLHHRNLRAWDRAWRGTSGTGVQR
ncbi:hypothetical protein [Streptomyces sp. 16-176A]|uniref:Rv1733c family protein n=1 Tax=Streptomyces sp. 16-176A TaxID=2530458 RepID=UPI00345C975E